ncbi:GNAT family N-acetyltransferase [Plastorhodobacter daqingensis]|uniref:GNAT family N-acetyltransferase n=1 Tax=Plastorhodobacter daqingensis TaxID=1387281 RepID=A0ABW2UJ26_9RHOB
MEVSFRIARRADLRAIIGLLADDALGAAREDPAQAETGPYLAAFEAISRDPNQMLLVMTEGEAILGTLQLSFLPGLSRRGAWRGQIEGVRVASTARGRGLGARLIAHAVDECRARGCALVQLTTDQSRTDAHRFYERLGFSATHLGYKLTL